MKHDPFSIADRMDSEGINPVCQNMVNLRLAGNVTPITWFKSIRTNSGKPDIVAIMNKDNTFSLELVLPKQNCLISPKRIDRKNYKQGTKFPVVQTLSVL